MLKNRLLSLLTALALMLSLVPAALAEDAVEPVIEAEAVEAVVEEAEAELPAEESDPAEAEAEVIVGSPPTMPKRVRPSTATC